MSPELMFLNTRMPYKLLQDVPILSGNMKSHIRLVNVSEDEIVYEISAPQYDMNTFRKTGRIQFTGKTPDYAIWVNDLGAFATHNKSEHWLNRSLYELCYELKIAKGGEAIIINDLPLDYGVSYMKRSGTKYSTKFKREVKKKG